MKFTAIYLRDQKLFIPKRFRVTKVEVPIVAKSLKDAINKANQKYMPDFNLYGIIKTDQLHDEFENLI